MYLPYYRLVVVLLVCLMLATASVTHADESDAGPPPEPAPFRGGLPGMGGQGETDPCDGLSAVCREVCEAIQASGVPPILKRAETAPVLDTPSLSTLRTFMSEHQAAIAACQGEILAKAMRGELKAEPNESKRARLEAENTALTHRDSPGRREGLQRYNDLFERYQPVPPVDERCFVEIPNEQLVFAEDWEARSFSGYEFKDQCTPYNFAIVSDAQGNDMLRVENRLYQCGGGGGGKTPRARNELKRLDDTRKVELGEDFWWYQRIYVPSDWPATLPVTFATIMQIIAGDGGEWDPDFKLTMRRDGSWGWDGPGGGRWPVQRGAWAEYLIHYKRSVGSDGVAEVWYNGTQVVDYRGKTTFSAQAAAAWKYGIYTFSTDAHNNAVVASGQHPNLVLYFDDTFIATSGGPMNCEPVETPSSGEDAPQTVLAPAVPDTPAEAQRLESQ